MSTWRKPRKHSPPPASELEQAKYSMLSNEMESNRKSFPYNLKNLVIFILFFGIVITTINIYELRNIKNEHLTMVKEQTKNTASNTVNRCTKPKVWIHGANMETGYLSHVQAVFKRLGFDNYTEKDGKFDVLWSHDYPFLENGIINPSNVESHHLINHFPGCGYITNKVSLATSDLHFIPKAFKLPQAKEELLDYVKKYPTTLWVQKSNAHRGIKIEDVQHLDLSSSGTFIQEFVHNPLLIDGRKFDIGIYAVLTSLNPLRAYIFEGEALLRFCMDAYLPFDKNNVNSYVVGDDYLPTWKVPSLQKSYENGLSMKESLNAYLISKGKDPAKIWQQIREAIAEVYTVKEPLLIQVTNKYPSTDNFFEMVRFDFVVDEDLKIYLMEANMSPNLSSAHFRPNKPIYEQVIFNLLSLAGVGYHHLRGNDEMEMRVTQRDLTVSPVDCASTECQVSCQSIKCRLCARCLDSAEKVFLRKAFLEHQSRWNCRRIVPKPTTVLVAKAELDQMSLSNLDDNNKLMKAWFNGKCLQDASWCS